MSKTGSKKRTSAAGQGDLFAAASPKPAAGLRLFARTDGASRGNPGEAGLGVVFTDERGQEVHAIARYLGQTTNNQAEYLALLAALDWALEQGCRQLEVFSDSELMVRQVNGQYKVKDSKLKPLFAEIQKRVPRFAHFSLRHVRREENRRADELANQAIDEKA